MESGIQCPDVIWSQVALDTFKAHHTAYHPIAQKMVAADLGLSTDQL